MKQIAFLCFFLNCLFSFSQWDITTLMKSNNDSPIERAGDYIQLAIPLAGLGATYYLDDKDGRKQFWNSYISSLSITYFLKYSIDKTRPNGDCCESFPSGHTASAFAGAMFIQNRYGYKYGIPSIALASFVGYSRVEGNKHFWEDVIAGASISALMNFIFTNKKSVESNINSIITYNPIKGKLFLRFYFK